MTSRYTATINSATENSFGTQASAKHSRK